MIKALYEEENLKEYNQRILELDTEYLEEIYYNSADGNGYLIFQEDKEKAKKLIEALKQDIQESDSEVFKDSLRQYSAGLCSSRKGKGRQNGTR